MIKPGAPLFMAYSILKTFHIYSTPIRSKRLSKYIVIYQQEDLNISTVACILCFSLTPADIHNGFVFIVLKLIKQFPYSRPHTLTKAYIKEQVLI